MAYQPIIRLFLETDLKVGKTLSLDKTQAHYLGTVMRQKIGSKIAVFNGYQGEFLSEIKAIDRKAASLTVLNLRREQKTEPDIWLAFAPIKSARTDFIAEKATELGVARLIPVKTERTNAGRVNRERLAANAREAAEQCERLTIPEVDDLTPLMEFLKGLEEGRHIVFADESLEAPALLDALLDALAGKQDRPIVLLTGPEGGFSDKERTAIKALPNTIAVHLGPRILRADTAALAGLSLIQASIGDWRDL